MNERVVLITLNDHSVQSVIDSDIPRIVVIGSTSVGKRYVALPIDA